MNGVWATEAVPEPPSLIKKQRLIKMLSHRPLDQGTNLNL